ncbi:MAG: helix-turn-helix transcriptional regulator [Verrucomicrobiota bacterium]
MNRRLEMGAALNPGAGRLLAQLLGSAQRTIRVKHDFSKEKFSVRKAFPTTPKTIGDHLILKRFIADLSQEQVAAILGVSNNTLSSWENDKSVPPVASRINDTEELDKSGYSLPHIK